MTVAEDPALASQLPQDIGGGFTRVADDDGEGLGPLDLTRASAAEADTSAERALLETRHFERGHARAWRNDDGRLAYAAVYQFASGGDASAYLVDGLITLEGRGARVYDVTEVAGGRGFSQAGSDGSGSEIAHGVAFVRDRRFFLVFVSSTDSSATAAAAIALARTVDAARIGVAP